MVKAALRSMWEDVCMVVEYRDYQRDNKSTGKHEVIVLENEPCKLSFERLNNVNQSDTAAGLIQTVKLFLDEGIIIKPGSKIIISRNSNTFVYGYSGVAGVFTNHQEIMLVPFEGFA